ncbi:MAG: hypothetical protein JW953_11490, partial [Anaerolineae bacterium]|nr:hypothetical protein [Anaerolineae bacterium]
HFIDTLWDIYELNSDLQSCLGGFDRLSCYMLPVSAGFLALPFATGGGSLDNIVRQADGVGGGGLGARSRSALAIDDPLVRRMRSSGWNEAEISYYKLLQERGENARSLYCYDAALMRMGGLVTPVDRANVEGLLKSMRLKSDVLEGYPAFRKVGYFGIDQTEAIMGTLKPRDLLLFGDTLHVNRVLDVEGGITFLDKWGSGALTVKSWGEVKQLPLMMRGKGHSVDDFGYVLIYRPQ